MSAVACGIDACKAVEDAPPIGGCDTSAVVGHDEFGDPVDLRRLDRHCRLGVLLGVVDKVRHDARAKFAIPSYSRRVHAVQIDRERARRAQRLGLAQDEVVDVDIGVVANRLFVGGREDK